jgi:predicted DNA-binding transcriptional regulator AlpA
VPTKTKHKPQMTAARKAAFLHAANAASRRATYPTSLQEENLKAQVAADAYEERLLTKVQVLARVGVTFPPLWKMMRKGQFPQARFLLHKTVWLEREADHWIRNLPLREYLEVSKKA